MNQKIWFRKNVIRKNGGVPKLRCLKCLKSTHYIRMIAISTNYMKESTRKKKLSVPKNMVSKKFKSKN